MKRSKLGAVAVTIDGHRFASKAEGRRYQELALLEKAGHIHDLQCQVPYRLHVRGTYIGKYIADFVYTENDQTVVEDVKGMTTGVPYQFFRWKAKHLAAEYGLTVREVHMTRRKR